MATKTLPSIDVIRQLIRYSPETGQFYWLHRGVERFTDSKGRVTAAHRAALWNGKYDGKEAMTADNGLGYRCGSVLGVGVKAHRLAWALYYGRWPTEHLDHINGARYDNRISNLREVTPLENAQNARIRRDNTSGVQGVGWVARDRRWHARIGNRSLGYFVYKGDAVKARMAAEIEEGYHENHGRS